MGLAVSASKFGFTRLLCSLSSISNGIIFLFSWCREWMLKQGIIKNEKEKEKRKIQYGDLCFLVSTLCGVVNIYLLLLSIVDWGSFALCYIYMIRKLISSYESARVCTYGGWHLIGDRDTVTSFGRDMVIFARLEAACSVLLAVELNNDLNFNSKSDLF